MSAVDSKDGIAAFFTEHLGGLLDRPLLPGLASLSTAFSLEVGDSGIFAIEIAAGRLVRAERSERPTAACHVRAEPADFARLARGEVTPQSLFVRRRLKIRGNPWHALVAASAMEEFFRRYPFDPEAGPR